jgi:outer membrane protein
MNRFYLLTIVLLIAFTGVQAQQTSGSSFTLDQAIQYALENSMTAKNATIDEQIAKAKVNETRGIGLPQVSASATVLHNQKLGRFFTTYSSQGGFVEIDPNDYPGIQDGDVVAAENFFQLKSNGQAGVSVSQILFNASYLVGLRAANAYKELSEKQSQQSREQIIENVSKAYYGAIINNERIKLFDANIARVDSLFRSTKAFNTNGFVEEIDVDRTEVALNNLLAERNKFINLQKLSLELLKFQMNYPLEAEITITGAIAELSIDRDVSALSTEWNYKSRVDYSILETNRNLQNLNIKNKYSEGLPSLVGFADFGYNTQSPTIGGIFKTNSTFDESPQLGADKWFPTTSFGVTLNVPLFSGLQRNYRIKQERLTALKIENSFTTLKQGIDLEIKQSKITYDNALTSLDAQSRNTKLAEKIARVTKIKYEQGVGSSLEVTEAESSLRESQINYYNALYDAVISRIDLIKAYGKINTLTTQQ